MAYRVLVVDDSEIIRSVIKKCLMMSGLEVANCFEAADGESALELLEREWVDVLLADINMPKMRGDEMIAKLRSKDATANLPVIVISSIRNQDMRDALTRLGVKGYLAKPFYPESLRAAIVQALDVQETV